MEDNRSSNRRWWIVSALALLMAIMVSASVSFASLPAGIPGAAPPSQVKEQPSTSNTKSTKDNNSLPEADPNVVLYDQINNPAPTPGGVTSQDFEAANDAFDSFAADDFVVPAGQTWSVTGVDVAGEYSAGGGPAAGFHVFFYNDAATLPGTLVASRLNQTYTGGANAIITLATPVVLTPGTYWVSVQARQDFTPAGQWFWDNRLVISNSGAAWQNPGNGFGTGCTTYGRKMTCLPTQNGPDQLFRINGDLVGGATATRTNTVVTCQVINIPSTDVPKPIGPNAGTVTTSTITVTQSLVLNKVEVTGINITHTFASDLDVFLISPLGTRVELFTDICGVQPWNPGDTGFTLNQRSSNLIGVACPPRQDVYRPEGNLDALAGQNSLGVWTLEITDDANVDNGTLIGWGLRLSSGDGCATKTANPTFSPTRTNTPTNTRTVTQTRTSTATPTACVGSPVMGPWTIMAPLPANS